MFITPKQFDFIYKWPLKKIAMFLVFSLFLGGGGVYWFFKESSSANNNQVVIKNEQNNESNNIIPATVLGEGDSRNGDDHVNKQISEVEFNRDDWKIDQRRMYQEKDSEGLYTGFFCVNDSKNFDSAIIWYGEKISLGTTLKLRYLLKSKKENVSKLIFVYGDKSDFRIFLPEDIESKFIGLEKTNSDGSKSRKHIGLLKKIDSCKENIFEITIDNVSSNKANFLYNLKYFPLPDYDVENENETKQVNDSDSFVEYLPWTDPGSAGFKQDMGVGAFNNNCIKIISATLI